MKKGGSGAALHARVSVRLCGPDVQYAIRMVVHISDPGVPQVGDFSRIDKPRLQDPELPPITTQNGAAARPRFESPVRRAAVVSSGPAAQGPAVSGASEAPPPHRGALSVAD
jgi:hypothetical protein